MRVHVPCELAKHTDHELVSPMWYDGNAEQNVSSNGRKAFVGKPYCHWLKGIWWGHVDLRNRPQVSIVSHNSPLLLHWLYWIGHFQITILFAKHSSFMPAPFGLNNNLHTRELMLWVICSRCFRFRKWYLHCILISWSLSNTDLYAFPGYKIMHF